MKSWLPPLFIGLALSSACGGETGTTDEATGGTSGTGGSSSGGGSTSASGGASATGGASVTGGSSSGGSSHSGGSSGSGGATSSSGGQVGTGGNGVGGSNGSGGQPGICGCDAASLAVCGVDGMTYDAGCGEICVPVEIACPGECPCDPNAGCGCTTSGSIGCDAGLMWECGGQDFDPMAPLDLACEDTGMSAIRYCCPVSVTADDFCPP